MEVTNPPKPQLAIVGVSLDHLPRSSQLFICCAGVFLFYLIYGYVQVSSEMVWSMVA